MTRVRVRQFLSMILAILCSRLDSVAMPAQTFSVPHLHFPQLFVLHQHYMVGWAPGSALCFFQCATYKFAVWTRALEPEDKVSSDGSDVWVVCGGGREVKVLQLVPVREALRQLLQLQLHDQARVVRDEYNTLP